MSAITNACIFAAEAHSGQKRKSGNKPDYIVHPLRVLKALQDAGETDTDVLIAAILHDVVEDTTKTSEDIKENFGVNVQLLVAEVTDDKSLLPSERKKLQIVNAPKKTAGGAHIKLADKADNCDDLRENPPQGWTIERVQAYFIWSRQVVRAVIIDTPVALFLKARLESIFSGSFTYNGHQHPCIPDGDLSELLEKYYVSLDQRVQP